MAEQVSVPKSVTREQFLEAVRTGVHDAMVERPRVLAAASLLPCINCRRGGRALEEVAAVYAALLHGERPPRELDDRPLPYLPRTCCRQAKAAAGAMVATATPLSLATTGTGSAAADPQPPQCGA